LTEAKLISALNEENLSHFSKTYVPSRLLLGPGPSNAHPEVLSALSLNPIGNLDEAYISLMSDVQQLLRYTWQCNNRLTLPMSGTGSAAMEASIANFIEEGEKILIAKKGYFGDRLVDMATRYKADVSVIETGDGVTEVLSTSGDTHLGGDDFDRCIVDHLANTFKSNEGIDLRQDKQALQRLTEAAEKAKIELSNATQSEINLPFITATPEGPKHLDLNLTRAKFEELAASLIDRCKTPVERAISDAKISTSEIDEVVMVGGSSRIPAVLDLVKKIIGKEPNQTVNPDEVVAVGAAIQGGVLAGEVKDILLLDVTPLSLGVETLGGVMTKMINRNTTVPTKKSETYSTAVDGQTNVEIHVLQGEREMASDNKSLGTFRLDGIPSAPRGVPQIEVTFDIDANGILSVTAKDKGSGKEQSISITGASTLSDNEVEKMVKDAESNASADKEKREKIDLKNQAETLVYQTEKQLGELGDKIDAAAKSKVEEKSNALKEATSKEDYESMKKLLEELQQELYAVGSSVYQQPGNQPPSPGAPGGSDQSDSNEKNGDDVIDADFTETKD